MDERAVCKGCGGEKQVGKGYRYCLACIRERNKKPGCIKCGEPKKPGSGNRYCQECTELQKWVLKKKRGFRPQRPCKKCQKVWISGNKQYCEACRTPVILCQKCHARPIRAFRKKYCLLCHLEAQEANREYRRGWQREQRKDPIKLQKLRDEAKEFRLRLKQDDLRRKRLNESRRLWWRRTHGSKPLSEEKYLEGNGKRQARLPAPPLAVAITEYFSKGNSLLSIANESGVQEKRIGEVYRGATDTVRMDIADKVCVVCGTTLEWVYREQVARGEISLRGDYDLDKAL